MSNLILTGDTKQDRLSILTQFILDRNEPVTFIYNPNLTIHLDGILSEADITKDLTDTYDLSEELSESNKTVILHEIDKLFIENLETLLTEAENNNITVVISTEDVNELSNTTVAQLINEHCERSHGNY